MDSFQKKGRYLTYQGTIKVSMHTVQNEWPRVKDFFRSIVGEVIIGATAPFEGDEEAYQTLFGDNNEGD